MVRRLPVIDEYAEDGRIAVFVGEHVIVLSELASFALESLSEAWVETRAVADALVLEFGPPPGDADGMAATAGVLAELEVQGVVELA